MYKKWTKEEIDYLIEIHKGRIRKDTILEFMKKYPDRTYSSVETKYKSLRLKSDPKELEKQLQRCIEAGKKTRFKKGQISLNKVPIGTIVVRKNKNRKPYKFIKVRDGMIPTINNFMLYHRYVWQQHYGEIPKGTYIVFKDGDSMNCDIDNLHLTYSCAERTYTTEYVGYGDEIFDTGATLSKLKVAIKEKENE